MRKIYILLTISLTFSTIITFSQSIDVKTFQTLPNDQTARVHYPVKDQNGEKCALIKVVTTQKGFVWEGGTLGITKVEKKTGEYWVYIPRGSKKITIKHDQLGVLRDYHYPEAIKEANAYEMVLTTANVKTVVEERKIPSQWLVVNSKPSGANVFIDGKLAGTTPFQRKYKEGEYTYRLEKPRYHNKAGQVNLKDEKERLEITLKPQFGNLEITSEPEEGMQIYLDDENTGNTTPTTLEEVYSGEHNVMLNSKWYQPKTKKVTVRDEQTTSVDFTLKPAFANVSVTTQPEAEILIDDQFKGTGSWSGRLMEGIYTIKAQKDKYYSQSEQLEVIAGENETLNFRLKGKTGSADIVTTPMDAQVYLDGEKQGTSPLTLKDMLVGSYELRMEKEGYGVIKKTLNIEEDETITLNEKLPDGKEVTLKSKPKGAKVYVDDELQGTTPKIITLSFGEHLVKMKNGERIVEKKINISQRGKRKWDFEVYKNRGTFTDERDGKVYKWVRIGEQVWMAENLAYDAGWGCWAYDENEKNVSKYGYLYSWETAQKVCPLGWHIPSDKEWAELAVYISKDNLGNRQMGDDWKRVGGHLKATYDWKLGGNGKDDYGFSGLPGGYFSSDGNFRNIGYYGYWWSATDYNRYCSWYYHLYYDNKNFYRTGDNKDYGFSVRCIRDE